jgi:hypothetical protein
MKGSIGFIVTVLAVAAQPALAQTSDQGVLEPAYTEPEAAVSASRPRAKASAPSNAWEFALGAGYSQGVGDIGGSSPTLTELTHGGGELQMSVGYRIDPNWMVGVYASGGKYSRGNLISGDSDVWSASAGVQVNYHLLPEGEWDPWIGLGSGWRGHWIDQPAGTDSRHGLDMARLQVGVDYRISPEFSIAPYAGASATIFLSQKLAQDTGFSNIHDPNVNVFFFGGVMGRFDVL